MGPSYPAPRRVIGVLLLTIGMAVAGSTQELAPQSQPQPAQQQPAQQPAEAPANAPANAPAPATTSTAPPPPAPSKARKLSYELDVAGGQQWTDTGVDLQPGDHLALSAAGTIQNGQFGSAGPNGLSRNWEDLLFALPVNAAGRGALVGRIGNDAAAVPFLLGAQKEMDVRTAGRLFLGINQVANAGSDGSYKVKLQIVPRTKTAQATAAPKIDPQILEKVPRRVTDANGKPGDIVNFLVLGSQEAMQQAFQDAGWVLVDRTKGEAVLHAILSSMSKESYVEMPMSELYLFGRVQDFGYARAEPIQVVKTRHHLRVWKAPFGVNGTTVWAGAATHDIGFEKDQRTGGVTHKIDANIDNERQFVGDCFKGTSEFAGSTLLTPPDPVHDTQTATGGAIHTDGRVLVIVLGAAPPQASQTPAGQGTK